MHSYHPAKFAKILLGDKNATYLCSNIISTLSILGGTALTALILHEMSDSFDKEVHENWEQEFLDYANNLEVSQF